MKPTINSGWVRQDDGLNRPSWRFLHTGSRSPAENMAIDEAISIAHKEGAVPPTVRFYGWNPASLSIGYFQKAEKEVDFQALRELGLGFVRRSTGGRAVLHDQELTYSIVVSEQDAGISANVAEAYAELSSGLLIGVRKLGLDAAVTGQAGEPEEYSGSEHVPARRSLTAACFDAPSKHELVVGGRKIAGSAQMRGNGVILQHGSILLELDNEKLFSVLRFASPELRQRMFSLFGRKAASINDCLRRSGMAPVSMQRLEQVFRESFAEGLGVELVDGGLTEDELELASRLSTEKYGADSWNYRR
ncbi:lipoate--protein ligase family protein [Paenibacillus albus]|uniref:Lipoate--protein ligase family protein n=1 Tax=Paenibacillus albus TaxID=2495582 RepID=A0A3Q8X6R0_9BACL|nr:biotin/lipoate A/B protein ligase family protein [Paenibacillus albus]AZN41738.1 lipoate--protein ligase family protein [Paenibacillus albus]